MSFDQLPFADKIEIENALAAALAGYALGAKRTDDPLAQDPVGSAVRDAPLVYNKGWATKKGHHWQIDLKAYLAYRASLL